MNLLSRRRALMMKLGKLEKILKKIAGIPPLVLNGTKGENAVDYKIEGNSIQDGEPTPEAPIEVESVGEKTINLFEKRTDSISTNVAYKGLDMRGWKQTDYTLQIKLKKGKTVPTGVYFGFIYTDIAAYWLVDNGVINSKYNGIVSVHTANAINGVCCYPASKSEAFWNAFDIFLVQGKYTNDTIPDFESIGYKIPVVAQGKNLFDYDNVNFMIGTSGNNIIDCKENNSFNIDNSNNYNSYYHTTDINAFNLKPNTTYTSKAIITLIDNGSNNINEAGSMSTSLRLQTNRAFDAGAIVIVNGYKITDGNKVGTYEVITTFTTPKDMTNYKYVATRLASYTQVIFKDIIITEGVSVGEYEPYQEPITTSIYLNEPLRKVGDYSDYIDFENKKVVRNIGYAQMLSSYPYVKSGSSTTNTIQTVIYNTSPFGKAKLGRSAGFCNIGKVGSGVTLVDKNVVYWCYNTNASTFFGVPTALLTELGFEHSLQGVKDFIDYQNAIEPIMIQYILANPTEELVELPQLPTLKGTTVYTIDTTIQPSNMKATYYSKGA